MNDGAEQPPEPSPGRSWRRGWRRGGGPPPPTQRAWIHPSELPSFEAIPEFDGAEERRHLSPLLVLGGVIVLVLGSMTLALRSSNPPTSSALPDRIANSVSDLPAYARSAANSTIELVVTNQGHVQATAAMVIAPGDLAVTTEPILPSASITGSSQLRHRFPVTLISYDRALGFSLVRLGATLPLTPTASLPNSAGVLALAPYFTAHATSPKIAWGDTTLGDPVRVESEGVVSYLATASAPNLHGYSDTIAIDVSGRVVAVLSAKGQWFSASYLTRVAQVVTQNGGCHGLLGIDGVSAQGGGVVVDSVPPGPSTNVLHRGDIITDINDVSLDSIDSLLSFLYAYPAHHEVDLQILRHGVERNVGVMLGCQP